MRTYRKFKTMENHKCEDYGPPPDHQSPQQNDVNKIAIRQPQTITIGTDRYLRSYKKPEERMCLDLFGCCLRKQGERVGLFSQIRGRDIYFQLY